MEKKAEKAERREVVVKGKGEERREGEAGEEGGSVWRIGQGRGSEEGKRWESRETEEGENGEGENWAAEAERMEKAKRG